MMETQRRERILGRNRTKRCPTCGVMFDPLPWGKGREEKLTCSHRCLGVTRIGRGPNWRGGVVLRGGYVWETVPIEERYGTNLWQGRYRPQHILVVERTLKRRLKKGEVVHHINGDKTDNRNCNLLVCSTQYHGYLHTEMSRRYQREKFGVAHG